MTTAKTARDEDRYICLICPASLLCITCQGGEIQFIPHGVGREIKYLTLLYRQRDQRNQTGTELYISPKCPESGGAYSSLMWIEDKETTCQVVERE